MNTIDISKINYSALDRPEVLNFLFHPRPQPPPPPFQATDSAGLITHEKDILIPVEDEVVIGARFHMAEKSGANLLFFHGNGEIVTDYDELGPVYNQMGVNFLAVDYRGYGRSTGKPTVTAMMRDCHVIFEFVRNWLRQNNFPGPILLMGRSLGSASVLELAAAGEDSTDGLIVESGFAYAAPLLRLMGIDLEAIGFKEEKGFRNIDKIRNFKKPTLIIHAEFDHIIPFPDGEALYNASSAPDKTFLKIPGANHNDIFMRGLQEYLAAVKNIVERVKTNIQ
ncbi:MAG: alpha/beta hydrolase [Desulfobacterales bacterium]